MALPSSGEISLNEMHVEVGGGTGTEVTINDTDIRRMISKASQSEMSFSEWYSASVPYSITPSTTIPNEGVTVTFTVVGKASQTYYYLQGTYLPTGSFDWAITGGGAYQGFDSFTTDANGDATFQLDTVADTLTEGSETFYFMLKETLSDPTLAQTADIIIQDTSLTNFSLTPSSTTTQEGGLNLSYSAVGNPNTTYYITVNHITTTSADFSLGSSGSITMAADGTATWFVGHTADNLTEGSETYQLEMRSGSASGTVVATSPTVTISDTSTTSYSISPSSTSMNEGASITVSIGGVPSSTYFWEIVNGTTASADFSSSSGLVSTNSSGNGSFTVTTTADQTTEGSETFTVRFRDSPGGTIRGTTNTITIADTSQNVSLTEDPYYEMHLIRTITGQTSYWATVTDSLSSYAGQKGRVVFHYVNGSNSTSYRGDIQIDDVNFDGNSYSFESSGQDWVTSTAMGTGTTSGMDSGSLGTFQDRIGNYSNVTVSTGSYKWNSDANGTSSSSTGLSTANSGSYYLYAETSGSGTLGGRYTTASPLVQLSNSPGNLTYAQARYGSNIGTLRIYWAENKTTDPYPPPASVDVYGPWTSTTTNAANWINANSSTVVSLQYGQFGGVSTGDTCRLLIAYISGPSYRGDLQLDDWWANVSSTSTSGGTFLSIDSTQSQKSNTITTYSSAAWNTSGSPTQADIENIYNNSTWSNVSYGTTAGTWNLDASGTPSSSTGLTNVHSGYYCYFEATSPGYAYKMRLLRSRQFTAIANRGFRGKIGHYGADMGRMRVYIVKE